MRSKKQIMADSKKALDTYNKVLQDWGMHVPLDLLLTELQESTLKLRCQGKTQREIASLRGKHPVSTFNTMHAVHTKIKKLEFWAEQYAISEQGRSIELTEIGVPQARQQYLKDGRTQVRRQCKTHVFDKHGRLIAFELNSKGE